VDLAGADDLRPVGSLLVDTLNDLADAGQLVRVDRLPARAPRHRQPTRPLPEVLVERIPPGGLWWHQACALDQIRAGRSTVLATGTSSGKSLCFQLAVAEGVLSRPPGTALLLYPTKALAQDQLRSFAALSLPGVVCAAYDGDTDPDDRSFVRRHANVILTNPDMLHLGILPNHEQWAGFLSRLRYVVVDELHTLRGIFGSHVAHVLRRLRRLCARYGACPTFVCASATLGQPGRLASALAGLEVAEVADDGSPRGERLLALWNPPVLDPARGLRTSAHTESARILAGLVAAGFRCIAFTRSRRATETVAETARRLLSPDLATAVQPYRGGYLALQRRQVEADLAAGRLRGVVATTALELGVDIAGLDACVMDGFPGTVSSFRQRAGRVGRSGRTSLTVLVAGADALDQWVVTHPEELLRRPAEPAVVNPANPFVADPHVDCAAYEQPLAAEDERWWGQPGLEDGAFDDAVRRLVIGDRLAIRGERAVHVGLSQPARRVSLRSGSGGEYRIIDRRAGLIGTTEEARAFASVHPGAVYLHQGQHYRVEHLDLDERVAWVAETNAEETTEARSETEIAVLGCDLDRRVGRSRLVLGPVQVRERVTGYQRRDLRSGRTRTVPLDLPPTVLLTRAFWYQIDEQLLEEAGLLEEAPAAERAAGSLHAAEHAGIGILPLFTICDRWDVGGVSTLWLEGPDSPAIVIYDGYPGGAGIAELGFEAGIRHLQATLDAIVACPCESGCPSCVQSPKCGNLNEPLDKAGARALLEVILHE
jgi:DEAD/DEAH box helicase domain-containing protein